MSVNQTAIVQRIRNIVADPPYALPITNGLTGSSSTSLQFDDATIWTRGNILEWQDNGEQNYITAVTGSVTGTVIRGWNNTTITGHASGSVAYKDPRFTYAQTVEAISLTIQELFPYAYKKKTTTVTPATGTPVWVDLASDALGLISVTQVDTTQTPTKLWSYGDKGTGLPVGFRMNLPITLCASTIGIIFPRGYAETTDTVQVDYAAMLTDTVSGSAYVDIVEGTLADCIVYGAAARMIEGRDNPRTTQQDTGMHDASVQPGMAARQGNVMWNKFQTYKFIYFEMLRRTIPIMYGAAGPQGRAHIARGASYTSNAPY